MEIAGFDWDEGNQGKHRKHGVSRAEIEGLFANRVMILSIRGARNGSGQSAGPDVAERFLSFSRSGSTAAKNTFGRSALGTCIGRRLRIMKKKIPSFKTDKEAERFVDTADLTEYDLSGARPVRFEFERKAAQINTCLRILLSRAGARTKREL